MTSQSSEMCNTCGCTIDDCKTNAAQSAQTYLTLVAVATEIAPNAAESIRDVVSSWRTHSLATCDPLAIY